MALNPFFLQGSPTEQGLVQDLINEQLRMYGVEVHYIPRKYITKKTIIEEVIQSTYDKAFPIEAYLNTFEGYEGPGTILSKFGIQPLNDVSLIISKERFELAISPLIATDTGVELSTRPKEGDLIYFPLGDRLFEIKFVEHEQPFYQLNKTYVYELRCELYRYEDEVLDTGIEEIDDNVVEYGHIETLTVVGVGTTATAITTLTTSGIQKIYMTSGGSGYTQDPILAISQPISGGTTFVPYIVRTNNFIDAVQLINPGFGYTVASKPLFLGGCGAGAAATVGITTSGVGIVTITAGGANYTTTPTVTFSNPVSGGTTATGVAVMSGGQVIGVRITDAGVGYTMSPTITFSSPSISTTGIGTYVFNEIITGSLSGTTARVKTWDNPSGTVTVGIITGTFKAGEIIIGSQTGARYTLKTEDTYNNVDKFNQNKVIESEAKGIIDFTERNPFGDP